MKEEERQKGLDRIDSDFLTYTTDAPREDIMGGEITEEHIKEYSLLCRNSVLHALRLAARLEANSDLMDSGDYHEEVKQSIGTVMEAFKATENLNAIKSFLGLTRSANAINGM